MWRLYNLNGAELPESDDYSFESDKISNPLTVDPGWLLLPLVALTGNKIGQVIIAPNIQMQQNSNKNRRKK